MEVVRSADTLHHLLLTVNGRVIGEYERSTAQHMDRKRREIQRSTPFLPFIYRKHGPFEVRWDGTALAKSVRVNGVEVAQIPTELWEE